MQFFTLKQESELIWKDCSSHLAQLCEKLSCFELKMPLSVGIKLCFAISRRCLVLDNAHSGISRKKI